MIIKSPHLGERHEVGVLVISPVEFLRPRAKCIQVIKVDPFEREKRWVSFLLVRPRMWLPCRGVVGTYHVCMCWGGRVLSGTDSQSGLRCKGNINTHFSFPPRSDEMGWTRLDHGSFENREGCGCLYYRLDYLKLLQCLKMCWNWLVPIESMLIFIEPSVFSFKFNNHVVLFQLIKTPQEKSRNNAIEWILMFLNVSQTGFGDLVVSVVGLGLVPVNIGPGLT